MADLISEDESLDSEITQWLKWDKVSVKYIG